MERQPGLATLPNELVSRIGSYLCASNNGSRPQRALARLSQTCRRFNEIFQPMLFLSYSHNEQPVSHMIAFLRAITSRADLAAVITDLNFRYPPEVDNLTVADKDFIDTCVTNLGLPLPRTKDWHIDGPDRTIPMQIVIAYASRNLEHLSIPVNEEWDLALLPSFPDVTPKITFPRLKHLSIYYFYISGDRWAINFHQIAPLINATPNLEYLGVPTLEGFWEEWESSKLPKLKLVKTLDLGESSSGMFFVTSIIKSCESLQNFELHWGTSNGYDESHEEWRVVDIWDALVLVKGTIQKIVFESALDIPLGVPTANSVSSLSEFTCLKILKIDGRSLEAMFQAWTLKTRSSNVDAFVAQLLPAGIQSLAIWTPSNALIPALLALARGKSGGGLYEALTTVEIGASTVFKYWLPRPEWSSSQAELWEEFERAGVQLTMDIPHVPPQMLNFAFLGGGFVG